MATLNVFSLGGIDKKSNDLTREHTKASDMLNCEYDTQSTLKKRTGYSEITIDALSLPSWLTAKSQTALDDIISYRSGDKLLAFTNDGTFENIWELSKSGGLYISKLLSTIGIGQARFPVSYTEVSRNLYFTFKNNKGNIGLNNRVFKYDGCFLYSSGLLVPYNTKSNSQIVKEGAGGVFSGIASSSGYYVRVYPKFTDNNGLVTFGPYLQSLSMWNTGSTVTLSSWSNQNSYNKYLKVTQPVVGGTYILNSSNRTVATLASGHNYVAGDVLFLKDTSNYISITAPSNRVAVSLVVESVTGTSVTFTAASLSGVSVSITEGVTVLFDRKCEYVIAISKSQDTGYYITNSGIAADMELFVVDISSATNALTFNDSGFSTGDLIPFADVYDFTTMKTCPPMCGYIESYGEQIVYGDVYAYYDLDNNPQIVDVDMVVFSDLSIGDNCENVSELNLQQIGDSFDGDITGMKRVNDSFVVFKNNGVYTFDGALIPNQYQLRKISTNGVGCTNERSIVATDGGAFFQAHNGIYFTNAIGVKRVTQELDYLFTLSSYTTTAVNYKKKQKCLFYVSELAKTVVIDYYYNQVYIWSGIPFNIGFEDINTDIIFTNKTKLYKFNALYSDDGNAIDAYYSTTYHHCGAPDLIKKFLAIRVYSLTTDAFTMKLYHDSDWSGSAFQNEESITFTSSDQTGRVVHDMKNVLSQRYTFRNNTLNEPLSITGYTITWEPYATKDKN